MKTRHQIALPFAALAGLIVMVSAWPLAWNSERKIQEQARSKADSYIEEVSRVGRESILSTDDMMLISYVKTLQAQNPTIEYAMVRKPGLTMNFGVRTAGTMCRAAWVNFKETARTVVLGFDVAALEQKFRSGTEIPDAGWLAGLGLLLSLVASGAYLAARPIEKNLGRMKDTMDYNEDVFEMFAGDMRTQLGSLRGYLAYVEEHGKITTNGERIHAYVARAAGNMEASLKNAMELSGKPATRKAALREITVNEIVAAVIEELSPSAVVRSVTLKAPNARPMRCWADAELLRRAAFHLISHAIRSTPTDGTVAVHLRQDDDHVFISVDDTGPGIAPEHHEYIFTKAYRPMGGPGLSAAKHAVDMHNGRIWAENKTDKGAAIHVAIPKGTEKN